MTAASEQLALAISREKERGEMAQLCSIDVDSNQESVHPASLSQTGRRVQLQQHGGADRSEMGVPV